MALKDKPNSEIFSLYDNNPILRIHNAKNLRDTRNWLTEFREYPEESNKDAIRSVAGTYNLLSQEFGGTN